MTCIRSAPQPGPEEPDGPSRQEAQVACIRRIRALRAVLATEGESPSVRSAMGDATDALWRLTHGLVRHAINGCLRAHKKPAVTVDDLEQEGVLVLMKAVDTYRDGEASFANFLIVSVQRRVRDILVAQRGTIRVSAELVRKVATAKREFFTAHGREAEPEELAPYGIALADMELISRAQRVASGSQTRGDSTSHQSWDSQFADHREGRSALLTERAGRFAAIVASVDRLGVVHPRAPAIVRARFGITEDGSLSGKKRSFAAIAADLGLSTRRVQKVLQQALCKIQEWSDEDEDDSRQAEAVPSDPRPAGTPGHRGIAPSPVPVSPPVHTLSPPRAAGGASDGADVHLTEAEAASLRMTPEGCQLLDFLQRPWGSRGQDGRDEFLIIPSAEQPHGPLRTMDLLRAAAHRAALARTSGTSPPAWLPQPLHDRWACALLTDDERVALALLFAFYGQSCKPALTACFPPAVLDRVIECLNADFLRGEYVICNTSGMIGLVRDTARRPR